MILELRRDGYEQGRCLENQRYLNIDLALVSSAVILEFPKDYIRLADDTVLRRYQAFFS